MIDAISVLAMCGSLGLSVGLVIGLVVGLYLAMRFGNPDKPAIPFTKVSPEQHIEEMDPIFLDDKHEESINSIRDGD